MALNIIYAVLYHIQEKYAKNNPQLKSCGKMALGFT